MLLAIKYTESRLCKMLNLKLINPKWKKSKRHGIEINYNTKFNECLTLDEIIQTIRMIDSGSLHTTGPWNKGLML